MDRKRQATSRSVPSRRGLSRAELLDREQGTYLKKWQGLLPVGLFYPNRYQVGMSNLGFQLVYRLLNEHEGLVCERLFLPEPNQALVSVESGRPPRDFPIIFISVSFEHDYANLARFFLASGLEPLARERREEITPGNPLVVCGGVAAFMNPEPLAPLVDIFAVGEAEPLLPTLIGQLAGNDLGDRRRLLATLNQDYQGFYAPDLYHPLYDGKGRFERLEPEAGLPERIRRIGLESTDYSAHSELLTPETEFADLYLTELGRGCSRGCRFCAAGFIYRPPRLWDIEAILNSLKERPDGIDRIGLLGMEMTSRDNLDMIAANLSADGCSLSFSSLRADRISDNLVGLLSDSSLKSVAIAPDGGSERLRRVINKQLTATDLLGAAEKLTEAGIHRLKLYLMIGLPTEALEDLEEFVNLALRIREVMHAIGRSRGRLTELSISVNSFVPKPWTPFQYHPFGGAGELAAEHTIEGREAVRHLKEKITYLRSRLGSLPNLRLKFDNPDQALFQAVLSRGDRRLAEVLLNMADSGISWKQALKQSGLGEQLFATRQYAQHSPLAWSIVDHGIDDDYLWREYRRSFEQKTTAPCDTGVCRICGVCRD